MTPTATNRSQKQDSLGFYTPLRSTSPDLTTLTRQRFRQTAYALLSATLMGSSLGLVIYQRRTISLHDNYTTTSDSPVYPSSIDSTTTPATTTFERLSVFLLSCWFPVAVWFVTLVATSFLVGVQAFIPRLFSPRTGILASHLVFSVVWVILASIQEVHENLLSSTSTPSSSHHHQQQQQQGERVWTDSPSDIEQTNNNVMDGEHNSSLSHQPQPYQKYPGVQPQAGQGHGQALGDSNLSSMAVSLCVVWYVAVILLGVATALLASSSTVLDSMMDQQLQEVLASEDEEKEKEGKEEEKNGLGFSNSVTIAVDTYNNNSSSAAKRKIQYPLVQKLTLALMILVLFYSQMWLFEWIHSAMSSLTTSGLAVSTYLGLFGLFSSAIMVTLGARLIPRLD